MACMVAEGGTCVKVLGWEGLLGTVGVTALGVPLTMLLPGSDAGRVAGCYKVMSVTIMSTGFG